MQTILWDQKDDSGRDVGHEAEKKQIRSGTC